MQGWLQVNADPLVGADNPCCGPLTTAGPGGPCLTVTTAIANANANPQIISIQLTAGPNSTMSTHEVYPIHLGASYLTIFGPQFPPWPAFPGTAGNDVFVVDPGGHTAELTYVSIGVDGQGNPSGAATGISVGIGASMELGAVSIARVQTGIAINGGTVHLGNNLQIQDVSGDGVVCRSDADPTTPSTIDVPSSAYPGSITVLRAGDHAVFAGQGCSISGSSLNGLPMTLGTPPPCPLPKQDMWGLWVEGNATVSGYGNVTCMSQDGLSLRSNPALATNAPSVTWYGLSDNGFGSPVLSTIVHNGCAGLYAEAGTLALTYATVSGNHWGAVQRSPDSSPTPGLITLAGGFNTLTCNTRAEPGACCDGGSCPNGADIWNNSGVLLDASNVTWDDSPVSTCNCNATLQNCTCTGTATGQSTPPDDVSVLNSPYLGSALGVTSVDGGLGVGGCL